ncbi:MAG: protein kinase domain-containing protein [Gammaproteobacteria bacterium]
MAEPRHAALPAGYILEQFHITEVLGQGGFGITYQAIDTRLQRTVAIKEYLPRQYAFRDDDSTVLPRDDQDRETFDWGLKRFIDEARALARFRHPNIVAVMQFLEANGTAYLVMEYEEGRNLEAWLALHPEGVAEDILVDGILLPLLDGLEKVHDKGLLHRDIKPENVFMRRDGTPVLIDFGASRPHGKAATATATSLISVGYTPFEQYGGAGRQGPWTDLYALAGTMYRVIAGQKPPDAIARQQGDALQPAVEVGRARYSDEFLATVDRALALDPAERPQSAAEFRAMVQAGAENMDSTFVRPGPAKTWLDRPPARWALGAIAGLAVAGALVLGHPQWRERLLSIGDESGVETPDAVNSVAVLPFKNMSADPEQEYFADGLAEELLNLLVSIPELRVAARTSSFSFKDENVDIRTIAEKLGVDHILAGSVRKAGHTLRITAQLIEADSGYHLWSQRFDRQLEDVFAIQDEIATAVVDALKINLLGEMPKVEKIDAEAYALYLQGRHFYERRTAEGYEKAVDAYQAALELEPEYAPAWAALGFAYFRQARTYRDVHESTALSRDAVERALALDDSLAEAHASMGRIRMYYDWDWQGADEATQRALTLEPGNVQSLRSAGALAAALGRLDEAIKLSQRGIELDPLNHAQYHSLGYWLTAAGRLEEAAAALRYSLELNPGGEFTHNLRGRVFLLQNQPQMALAEMHRETDPVTREIGTALALTALGRKAEADQVLAAYIEEHNESAALDIAVVYAWRGDTDQAFMWLDTAYEQRDVYLAEILLEPLGSLKSDPRWPAFLDKMGLPH